MSSSDGTRTTNESIPWLLHLRVTKKSRRSPRSTDGCDTHARTHLAYEVRQLLVRFAFGSEFDLRHRSSVRRITSAADDDVHQALKRCWMTRFANYRSSCDR